MTRSANMTVTVWILGKPANKQTSERGRSQPRFFGTSIHSGLTEQQQRSRNGPVNVSSVEHLSQDRCTVGGRLERSDPGDTHTAGHDEVRRMRRHEDRTGDHVEETELSLDPLGQDDGDDDSEGHQRKDNPQRSHSVMRNVFPVNVERGKVTRGRRQSRRVRVMGMTMAASMSGHRLGNGECAGSGVLEELHRDCLA
jgi:hypothetical protein